MAIGTAISFAVQGVLMLYLLDRRIGGLELSRSISSIVKMAMAAMVMGSVCLAVQHSPVYPHGETKLAWAMQLVLLMAVGATVYLGLCIAMGVGVIEQLLPKRIRK